MTWPLQEAVRTYLAASTGAHSERVAQCFAPEATVHDESRVHVGPEAIGAWAREAQERYRFALEIRNVEGTGDDIAVTTQVSGTFPGSPIILRHAFRLAHGKIRRLDIAPPDAAAEFAGKRVLVTGGTEGIGAAVVKRLRDAGAAVFATARKTPPDLDHPHLFVAADKESAPPS